MYRLLALFVVLAVVFAPGFVAAEEKKEKMAEGTVVKAADGKLTVEGKDKKEHTCEVAKDAKITCGGKECKLEDIKAGFTVKVTLSGGKITKVEATPKK